MLARAFALAILIAPGPAFADGWPTLPDPTLTPGVPRQDLTLDEICATKWGTDARHVTEAMKQEVIAAYHFDVKTCPLTTYRGKRVHRVEIDHLISRELGGADDVKNLWPECYEPTKKDKAAQLDGAHKKDMVENRAHVLVCQKRDPAYLAEMQTKITTNWIALYDELYPAGRVAKAK